MGVSLLAFDVFMTEEGFAIGDDEAGDAWEVDEEREGLVDNEAIACEGARLVRNRCRQLEQTVSRGDLVALRVNIG